ncbi:MAG: DUF2147 domain-containing protein [Schleiferiaceae bacterium]|nr:DUF2147 domain-containing protein [Schleiferiaceae bacterium]
MNSKLSLILLLILFSLNGIAQKADDILGVWYNEEKDGKIEVFKKNGKYHGKIIWIKDNTNDDGSSPRIDVNNPDPMLAKRTIVGTLILHDLIWDDYEWDEGEIYDPKSGKTYSCYAKLESKNELFVKGFVGFAVIGRSTIWTRAN